MGRELCVGFLLEGQHCYTMNGNWSVVVGIIGLEKKLPYIYIIFMALLVRS